MLPRSFALRATIATASICSGCLQPPPRACQVDDECSLSAEGTCRSPGYCVYSDNGCDSGLKFGPYAGEGLAGQCFVEDAEVDSSSSGGGSDEDGEDTTAGPQPSLELVAFAQISAPTTIDAIELAAGPMRIALAGHGGSNDGFTLALDPDGAPRWEATDPAEVGPHRIAAVGVLEQDIWIAGTRSPNGDGWGRPFVSRFDADGAVQWSVSWDTLGDDGLFDAGLDSEGNLTGVGYLDGRPWLVRLDGEGEEIGAQQWDIGPVDVDPQALALTGGGVAIVCGPDDPGVGLRIVDAAGALLARSAESLSGPCVAAFASPSTIVVGHEPGSIEAFDFTTTPRWTTATQATSITALAIDGEGHPTAVGLTSDTLVLEQLELDGSSSITVNVGEPGQYDRAALASQDGRLVLAAAASGQSEIALWRVEP